jgi:hypothetical protein
VRAHNYIARLSKQGTHSLMGGYTNRDKTEQLEFSNKIVNYARLVLRSYCFNDAVYIKLNSINNRFTALIS